MTIQELFEKAGGSWKLAGAIGVHQWTVERWKRSGIPYKHWLFLQQYCKVTPNDLDQINRKIRNIKN